MPFTPFHCGAGLLLKGIAPRQFSFSMFTIANIAMDIEPLYNIWHLKAPIHGPTHTLSGALIIGTITLLLGRVMINQWWRFYAKLTADYGPTYKLSWLAAFSGALLGTFSHLLLDAIMHADMHPFRPLSDSNPLLMPDRLLELHVFCILATVCGMVLLLIRAVLQGEMPVFPRNEHNKSHQG